MAPVKPDPHPVNAMTELPHETRKWLAGLTKDDVALMEEGLPLLRMVISFGKVSKWLAITAAGLLFGLVLLWESVLKIVHWVRG